MRSVHLLGLLLLCGCGARTTLSTSADPEVDASVRRRDAGVVRVPDGGRIDAGPAGTSCRRDLDCAGDDICRAQAVFTPQDLALLPLSCGRAFDGREDQAVCSARSECARGLCVLGGACVAPCVSDDDCDEGDRCREMYVTTSASAMQTVRGCAALVSAPDSVRVGRPEPGGQLNEESTLPSLAPISLVVYTAPADYVLLEYIVRSADGSRVYDAFEGGFPGDPPPAWGVTPTTVAPLLTILYPNGPNTPTAPDGYRVFISSDRDERVERLIATRAGLGREFDLDAYLVGGGGWTAPDGTTPPELDRLVEGIRDLLAGMDLRIANVRVHEVVGDLRRRYAVLEGEDGIFGNPIELPELHALSAGARLPSINVFFVRTMDNALGIASGIPGAQILHGTGASGVTIAVDLIPDDQLPGVVLHEIGHYMGLFHTSEIDGAVNDPLPDTEICGPSRDSDGDGFLLEEECVGAGADLLMFWGGTGVRISPQQTELMRRAFFVR